MLFGAIVFRGYCLGDHLGEHHENTIIDVSLTNGQDNALHITLWEVALLHMRLLWLLSCLLESNG